jgi:hypothetical protein
MNHYLQGLLQAESKNMERMEEVVAEADHQALHSIIKFLLLDRMVYC